MPVRGREQFVQYDEDHHAADHCEHNAEDQVREDLRGTSRSREVGGGEAVHLKKGKLDARPDERRPSLDARRGALAPTRWGIPRRRRA